MKSLLLAGADRRDRNLRFREGGIGGRRPRDRQMRDRHEQPVINAQVGGNIWFGTGPYKSLDDAKLARSTIRNARGEEPPAERRMTRKSN